ncbi:DUF2256 domain-containing protein [Aquabacterium fontiphilum]|uniref:DUF2256 domain-containing protein n=1 Tax=Aquabacterium fontiphilum TaxID=450365 RepID=UPI001376670B|nr:DUF2256 domain-containing protein [Aquabacterium fontiphilum]
MSTPLKGFKAHLPVKPCVHCQRPMAWRRKWARTWDEVRYCSERCRRAARGSQPCAT